MRMITFLVALIAITIVTEGHAVDYTPAKSTKTATNSISSQRVLRSYNAEVEKINNDGGNDEERGDLSGISKLAKLDSEWKITKVDEAFSRKIMLKLGYTPESFFTLYGLDRIPTKLDTSRKFVQWFRFAQYYRKFKGTNWFPDHQLYSMVANKLPEDKVASLFHALKDIPDVKNLAERMQTHQFKIWIDRGWNQKNAAKLFEIPKNPTVATKHDPSNEILKDFTVVYKQKKELTRSATMRL